MSGSSKTPIEEARDLSGVEEAAAAFEGPIRDRWTIARQRLAEYRRTGIALDADEVLDRFVANVKAGVAGET